jgi:hypothetical protein
LAIDLKIMNIKDATDNDALKGKLWTHLAQQGLCKNSGGGGGEWDGGRSDEGGIGRELLQQMTGLRSEMMDMLKKHTEKQTLFEHGISEQISNMQQSLSGLSGFVEDFKSQLQDVKRGAKERGDKVDELGRDIRGLMEAKGKQAEAVQEMRGQQQELQVKMNSMLERVAIFESNETERLPSAPVISQAWVKRVEKLELTEAEQDRVNQEKIKLDVRVSGLLTANEIDDTLEVDLLSKVTEALGKEVKLSGGELDITEVRVHRVRATRGGRASSTATSPPPPPQPQLILTCSSLEGKLLILKKKCNTSRGVRVSSELTIWQIRQKNLMWGRYVELKDEGKNAFFLGHRLFVQEGEGRSAKRNEVFLQ